jgi:hypothetical protein
MITWIVANGMQIGGVVFAVWFLNGLRKAIFKPRITYVSHVVIGNKGYFLTVKRQQLLPPWLLVEETWHLDDLGPFPVATRTSDGACGGKEFLRDRLVSTMKMRLLKEQADANAIAELDREMAREEKLAATIAAAQKRRAN